MLSAEQRADHQRRSVEAIATLCRHLRIGDLLAHTRCMGAIEKHRFTGWDGIWLCGTATADTRKYSKHAAHAVNDIAPCSVTHVNREAVATLDILAETER